MKGLNMSKNNEHVISRLKFTLGWVETQGCSLSHIHIVYIQDLKLA